MRQESNQLGLMTPNGSTGHSVNGGLVTGVPPPNVDPGMIMSEPLQPIQDIRVHTPHPMSFGEMY